MKVFFQIGTNDGNDNFHDMCVSEKPDMIVLVEANTKHIPTIEKNYENIKNVHIINKAIYYNDNEMVELFLPAKDGVYGQRAVQPDRKQGNHLYTDGQFSLLPMNDWGEKTNMCIFKAQTITFDSICDNLGITDIEYLQIDTEGFDSEIIKMIDLDKFNIKKIRYEKWNFDTKCFTKHNTNDTMLKIDNLGINGMNMVVDKLNKYNYILRDIHDSDGNDIIATKNT